MSALSATRRRRNALLSILFLVLASIGVLTTPGISQAAATLPCDIYGSAGTPCVGAYSTVRALSSSYDGPLYQVQRLSDGTTTDIGLLADGYANATAQDVFCAHVACVITELYDQSPQHNNLTIEGPGPDGPPLSTTSSTAYNFSFGQDVGANATALPVVAGGHQVYGIYIPAKTGYRNDRTTGVATGSEPEGVYMVTSGTHVNGGCCFDFGNAETNMRDNGQSHMDSVNITYYCDTPPCTGNGPWVEDDMENGQYLGGNGSNTNNTGNNSAFVTALVKDNGTTDLAIKGGNAQSGSLTTYWDGKLPNGYSPMHLEGGIVLGTGGGGDNNGVGSFFEGVITAGYPTDAADNAVQANITSVGYSGATSGGTAPAGTVVGPGGQCLDVSGTDSGINGAAVDLWGCQTSAIDQHWTHNSDNSLSALGRCLDITGGATAAGTKVELWDCNGGVNQKWVQQANGSLLNPQSGLCLDDPDGSSTDGLQLQTYTCNGTPAQTFSVNGGGMVNGPGAQCLDVSGADTGANGAAVDLWGCQPYAADQHWYRNTNGTLQTLGRCLDITGGGTTAGTKVELWDCNGGVNQKWVQQANGSLLNPQSGLCLDDPDGSSTDGLQLLPGRPGWQQHRRPSTADLHLQRHPSTAVHLELDHRLARCRSNVPLVRQAAECRRGAAVLRHLHPSHESEQIMRVLPVLAAAAVVAAAAIATPALAGTTTNSGTTAAAAQPVPLRVEPLGDSITWGYQSTTGDGYRLRLFNDMTAEGYQPDFVGSARNGTMSDPDNEGHSGWRIDQIAGITDTSLATYKPDVVALMIGTNDLGQEYQVSTAPDRLKALVQQILTDDPTATVLLADLIVSTNTDVAAHEAAYNATIPPLVSSLQAAGKHVEYVDMGALTTADLYDALHPNDGGYLKMGDAFNKGLTAAAAAGWIPRPASSTTGPIRSGVAGMCLDVNGGSRTNGTAVQIWPCNNTSAQDWTPAADGTLRAEGKCLDATALGTANATKVELWDCNGGANQIWQAYNGGYRNPVSGRCLDDPGFSTTNGTQLELWDCNGGSNQQWTLTAS